MQAYEMSAMDIQPITSVPCLPAKYFAVVGGSELVSSRILGNIVILPTRVGRPLTNLCRTPTRKLGLVEMNLGSR